MTTVTLLDMSGVADRLGLAHRTVKNYLATAEARRRDGTARVYDFPEPDARIGGRPAWAPETIDAWVARRPGRGGAFTGRSPETQHYNRAPETK